MRAGEHEVFAIWSAENIKADVIEAIVDSCIVPAQTPGVTAEGLGAQKDVSFSAFSWTIPGPGAAACQLHTHPDVRMSNLDRAWEVVRHVGALEHHRAALALPVSAGSSAPAPTSTNARRRRRLARRAEGHGRLVVV